MKTSIETINDEPCTVIWHNDEFRPDWPNHDEFITLTMRCGYEIYYQIIGDVATALPALPKHPKPDSETPPLLLPYRYASEGIFIVGIYGDEDYETCGFRQFLEMYHNGKLKAIVGAVDADGNRVEVAIKEECDELARENP